MRLSRKRPGTVKLIAVDKDAYVAKNYWTLLSLVLPDADVYIASAGEPIVFDRGGTVAAVLMPLRLDADEAF